MTKVAFPVFHNYDIELALPCNGLEEASYGAFLRRFSLLAIAVRAHTLVLKQIYAGKGLFELTCVTELALLLFDVYLQILNGYHYWVEFLEKQGSKMWLRIRVLRCSGGGVKLRKWCVKKVGFFDGAGSMRRQQQQLQHSKAPSLRLSQLSVSKDNRINHLTND